MGAGVKGITLKGNGFYFAKKFQQTVTATVTVLALATLGFREIGDIRDIYLLFWSDDAPA
jgi:hypothetical protein